MSIFFIFEGVCRCVSLINNVPDEVNYNVNLRERDDTSKTSESVTDSVCMCVLLSNHVVPV